MSGYVLTGTDANFSVRTATAGYVLTGTAVTFRVEAVVATAGYLLTGADVEFAIVPTVQPALPARPAAGGGIPLRRRRARVERVAATAGAAVGGASASAVAAVVTAAAGRSSGFGSATGYGSSTARKRDAPPRWRIAKLQPQRARDVELHLPTSLASVVAPATAPASEHSEPRNVVSDEELLLVLLEVA